MSDEELFAQAREVNLDFKATVAAAQLLVWDGDWSVRGYGSAASECADGRYDFEMGRQTTEGYAIEGTAEEAGTGLADRLIEEGWTDVKVRTYSGDVDNILVEARNREHHVELLTVDYSPGQRSDWVVVSAKSTCEAGDSDRVWEQQVPGWPTDPISTANTPDVEHPNDPPIFGYTEDGEPRY